MDGWMDKKYMQKIDGWMDFKKHMKKLMDRKIYENQMDG